MNFIKQVWNEKDITEYNEYLQGLKAEDKKCKWEKNITCTDLECIAVPATVVKDIAKEITKGNAESFLKLWPWTSLTSAYIIAKVISNIKDFSIQSRYLDKYANYASCWAMTDALKIKITVENEKEYWDILCEYLKSERVFKRRIGVILMFGYIQKEEYIHKIFSNIQSIYNEEEYYVNMAVAWLLCECFIKQRDITLCYLEKGILNRFVTNKTISKCRDSFRVSKEDKQMLLKYNVR